jgi:hypothetical protein
MTDADKHSLRCYISNCLEPALKFHQTAAAEREQEKTTAIGLALVTAKEMYQYHKGKAEAFASAIADCKEVFPEELTGGEE